MRQEAEETARRKAAGGKPKAAGSGPKGIVTRPKPRARGVRPGAPNRTPAARNKPQPDTARSLPLHKSKGQEHGLARAEGSKARTGGTRKVEDSPTPHSGERLQKVLAHAGVASRRAAEEMIAAGRVMVNGEVVMEMGVRVLPTDVIQVDSKRLSVPAPAQAAQELVYLAINKPIGVVSTSKDPQGRPTVLDLLKRQGSADDGRQRPDDRTKQVAIQKRVYPIGRLDVDSTGLLLLTNDGDLTFRITHPRYGLEKEYRVLVRGRPGAEAIQKLRDGVDIEGGVTAPAKVEHLTTVSGNTWLRVTVHEGRKRQVRLMMAAVGQPVIELQRTRVGPIVLGTLEPGKWRYLALHEIHALRKAVGLHASTYSR